MVYCTQCKDDVETETDDANGFTCCTRCGRVLDEAAFSSEVTFSKGAGGESTVNGHFVSEAAASRGLGRVSGGRLFGYQLDSHEKALSRGRGEVLGLVDRLRIHPRDDSADSAARLYALALQKNFTRGRRTAQVAAACLYIICRQDAKPFMLIDFSDALQVNVFTLGAVFMALCKALHMEELPMFQRPVDPSLYMNRFADRLGVGKRMNAVVSTALQLVASMKRDWMQTGRRPSGICGAALYIAAHIHGFEKSKRDVMAVVHIGEATLSRRVSEFAATPSADLCSQDFEERGRQLDATEAQALEAHAGDAQAPADGAACCPHIRQGAAHFARGMCRACYEHFLKVSGGQRAGANPPAFTRGIQRELAAAERDAEEAGGLLTLAGDEDADLELQMDAALCGNELQVYAQALVPAVVARPRRRPAAGAAADAAPATGQDGAEEPGPAAARAAGRRAPRRKAGAAEAAGQAAPREAADAARADAPGGGAADADALALVPVPEAHAARRAPPDAASGGAATLAGAPECAGGAPAREPRDGGASSLPEGAPAASAAAGAAEAAGEPGAGADEELSDLEDEEAGAYLHHPEEVALRRVIWEELNRDYTEQQQAKQRAADAAAAKVAEALARDAAATADGQPRKRGRGRPLGSKSKPRKDEDAAPAGTPEEALKRMLDAKKLSSKINYDNLDGLFSGSDAGAPKRRRADGAAASAPAASRRVALGSAGSAGEGRALGALRDAGAGVSSGGLGTLRRPGAPVGAARR